MTKSRRFTGRLPTVAIGDEVHLMDPDRALIMLAPKHHRLGPWTILVTLERGDGEWQCVGFWVSSPKGKPITASLLRSLPVGTLIDLARKMRADADQHGARNEPADLERRAQLRHKELLRRRSEGGRPRDWGPEHFAEVASIYLLALESGEKPTQSVARHFKVERSTAAKWVARARHEYGLLAPTARGRTSGLAKKARRRGS
jgi:hypothetical protein